MVTSQHYPKLVKREETTSSAVKFEEDMPYGFKEQSILQGKPVRLVNDNPHITNQNVKKWMQEDQRYHKSVKKIKTLSGDIFKIAKGHQIQFKPSFTCPEYNLSDYTI